MLGEWPGLSGLVLATGFSGTGFKISPAVGEALAVLVTGRPVAGSVDITSMRPGRFAEGEPVSPPFPYSDDL
jgi:glycine/D-amino acid oxidase-like deaminating enzyme